MIAKLNPQDQKNEERFNTEIYNFFKENEVEYTRILDYLGRNEKAMLMMMQIGFEVGRWCEKKEADVREEEHSKALLRERLRKDSETRDRRAGGYGKLKEAKKAKEDNEEKDHGKGGAGLANTKLGVKKSRKRSVQEDRRVDVHWECDREGCDYKIYVDAKNIPSMKCHHLRRHREQDAYEKKEDRRDDVNVRWECDREGCDYKIYDNAKNIPSMKCDHLRRHRKQDADACERCLRNIQMHMHASKEEKNDQEEKKTNEEKQTKAESASAPVTIAALGGAVAAESMRNQKTKPQPKATVPNFGVLETGEEEDTFEKTLLKVRSRGARDETKAVHVPAVGSFQKRLEEVRAEGCLACSLAGRNTCHHKKALDENKKEDSNSKSARREDVSSSSG
jgi:hypothetical protein